VINLTGGCGFSYIDNIGKARSRGFELEATVRPVDGLSIDLSAGYTDAKLTQDLISGATTTGPVIAAPKGTTLPDVPKWTFRAAPQVDFALNADWRGFARADAQYIGKSKRTLNTPTDDPRVLDRSDYVMLNLRLGLIRGKNEINLFVNNLLDKDTLIYKSYANFAPGTAYEGTQLRPRVIGISYKRNF
jgi:iron complex outermembrane receptor protein